MTSRERVLAVLGGRRPDRVPWFADLDYYATGLIAQGKKPPGFTRSDDYIAWHRELGAGFYLQGYFPFREIVEGCTVSEERKGNLRQRRIVTPKGTLSETWKWSDITTSEAPIERLIKSQKDLAAYRYYYEHMSFEPDFELASRRRTLAEDIGVVVCYTPRTPFMRMVSVDAGIENVLTAYLADEDEFEETLSVMKLTLDRAVDITVQSPADIVMIPENLSSEVVGKVFFKRYVRDCQSDWVDRIHGAGKYSTMHMDGTLKGLLREEAEIGFTFIEAMTPSPAGDLAIEEWQAYLEGTGVVAWGGLPGAFFAESVPESEFEQFVVSVLEVMRTEPRYVLGVADQVPPNGSERRIRRVAALVDEYGSYSS